MPIRLALSLLLLAAPALADRAEWRARVGLESGVDTNPARVYSAGGPLHPPGADAMGSVLGALEGRALVGRLSLSGGWDVGARGFLQEQAQSTLVQVARASAGLALGPTLDLVVRARGKDRRGAEREYTDLQASSGIAWMPDAQLSVELLAQVTGFEYREDRTLGFTSLGGALQANYRFDRRHALTLFAEASERHFGGTRAREPGTGRVGGRRRLDTSLVAGANYGFRGPISLTAGYTYAGITSNSHGETVLLHRLSVIAGVPLFWELTLLAQAGLQLASYPDGIYLSPELVLLEDDENQNSLALKLARPLSTSLDLELRWAVYQNRLPDNRLSYLRQVAGIGLSWRLR